MRRFVTGRWLFTGLVLALLMGGPAILPFVLPASSGISKSRFDQLEIGMTGEEVQKLYSQAHPCLTATVITSNRKYVVFLQLRSQSLSAG